MFNIHPSLLPAFPGAAHPSARAGRRLPAGGGDSAFVTAELDHGPIVAQGVVAVADDDTADSLAAKVLRVEHQIYPQAVRWFVEGRLTLAGQRVQVDGGSADGALVCPR